MEKRILLEKRGREANQVSFAAILRNFDFNVNSAKNSWLFRKLSLVNRFPRLEWTQMDRKAMFSWN